MEYKIKSGDTLSGIAKANGVSLDDVLKSNSTIKDPNKITVGQTVIIPDKEDPYQKAIEAAKARLKSGEVWGSVWTDVKNKFNNVDNAKIDDDLGTEWREAGAYERYLAGELKPAKQFINHLPENKTLTKEEQKQRDIEQTVTPAEEVKMEAESKRVQEGAVKLEDKEEFKTFNPPDQEPKVDRSFFNTLIDKIKSKVTESQEKRITEKSYSPGEAITDTSYSNRMKPLTPEMVMAANLAKNVKPAKEMMSELSTLVSDDKLVRPEEPKKESIFKLNLKGYISKEERGIDDEFPEIFSEDLVASVKFELLPQLKDGRYKNLLLNSYLLKKTAEKDSKDQLTYLSLVDSKQKELEEIKSKMNNLKFFTEFTGDKETDEAALIKSVEEARQSIYDKHNIQDPILLEYKTFTKNKNAAQKEIADILTDYTNKLNSLDLSKAPKEVADEIEEALKDMAGDAKTFADLSASVTNINEFNDLYDKTRVKTEKLWEEMEVIYKEYQALDTQEMRDFIDQSTRLVELSPVQMQAFLNFQELKSKDIDRLFELGAKYDTMAGELQVKKRQTDGLAKRINEINAVIEKVYGDINESFRSGRLTDIVRSNRIAGADTSNSIVQAMKKYDEADHWLKVNDRRVNDAIAELEGTSEDALLEDRALQDEFDNLMKQLAQTSSEFADAQDKLSKVSGWDEARRLDEKAKYAELTRTNVIPFNYSDRKIKELFGDSFSYKEAILDELKNALEVGVETALDVANFVLVDGEKNNTAEKIVENAFVKPYAYLIGTVWPNIVSNATRFADDMQSLGADGYAQNINVMPENLLTHSGIDRPLEELTDQEVRDIGIRGVNWLRSWVNVPGPEDAKYLYSDYEDRSVVTDKPGNLIDFVDIWDIEKDNIEKIKLLNPLIKDFDNIPAGTTIILNRGDDDKTADEIADSKLQNFLLDSHSEEAITLNKTTNLRDLVEYESESDLTRQERMRIIFELNDFGSQGLTAKNTKDFSQIPAGTVIKIPKYRAFPRVLDMINPDKRLEISKKHPVWMMLAEEAAQIAIDPLTYLWYPAVKNLKTVTKSLGYKTYSKLMAAEQVAYMRAARNAVEFTWSLAEAFKGKAFIPDYWTETKQPLLELLTPGKKIGNKSFTDKDFTTLATLVGKFRGINLAESLPYEIKNIDKMTDLEVNALRSQNSIKYLKALNTIKEWGDEISNFETLDDYIKSKGDLSVSILKDTDEGRIYGKKMIEKAWADPLQFYTERFNNLNGLQHKRISDYLKTFIGNFDSSSGKEGRNVFFEMNEYLGLTQDWMKQLLEIAPNQELLFSEYEKALYHSTNFGRFEMLYFDQNMNKLTQRQKQFVLDLFQIADAKTGEVRVIENLSEFSQAVKRVREQHPDRAADIDKAVAMVEEFNNRTEWWRNVLQTEAVIPIRMNDNLSIYVADLVQTGTDTMKDLGYMITVDPKTGAYKIAFNSAKNSGLRLPGAVYEMFTDITTKKIYHYGQIEIGEMETTLKREWKTRKLLTGQAGSGKKESVFSIVKGKDGKERKVYSDKLSEDDYYIKEEKGRTILYLKNNKSINEKKIKKSEETETTVEGKKGGEVSVIEFDSKAKRVTIQDILHTAYLEWYKDFLKVIYKNDGPDIHQRGVLYSILQEIYGENKAVVQSKASVKKSFGDINLDAKEGKEYRITEMILGKEYKLQDYSDAELVMAMIAGLQDLYSSNKKIYSQLTAILQKVKYLAEKTGDKTLFPPEYELLLFLIDIGKQAGGIDKVFKKNKIIETLLRGNKLSPLEVEETVKEIKRLGVKWAKARRNSLMKNMMAADGLTQAQKDDLRSKYRVKFALDSIPKEKPEKTLTGRLEQVPDLVANRVTLKESPRVGKISEEEWDLMVEAYGDDQFIYSRQIVPQQFPYLAREKVSDNMRPSDLTRLNKDIFATGVEILMRMNNEPDVSKTSIPVMISSAIKKQDDHFVSRPSAMRTIEKSVIDKLNKLEKEYAEAKLLYFKVLDENRKDKTLDVKVKTLKTEMDELKEDGIKFAEEHTLEFVDRVVNYKITGEKHPYDEVWISPELQKELNAIKKTGKTLLLGDYTNEDRAIIDFLRKDPSFKEGTDFKVFHYEDLLNKPATSKQIVDMLVAKDLDPLTYVFLDKQAMDMDYDAFVDLLATSYDPMISDLDMELDNLNKFRQSLIVANKDVNVTITVNDEGELSVLGKGRRAQLIVDYLDNALKKLRTFQNMSDEELETFVMRATSSNVKREGIANFIEKLNERNVFIDGVPQDILELFLNVDISPVINIDQGKIAEVLRQEMIDNLKNWNMAFYSIKDTMGWDEIGRSTKVGIVMPGAGQQMWSIVGQPNKHSLDSYHQALIKMSNNEYVDTGVITAETRRRLSPTSGIKTKTFDSNELLQAVGNYYGAKDVVGPDDMLRIAKENNLPSVFKSEDIFTIEKRVNELKQTIKTIEKNIVEGEDYNKIIGLKIAKDELKKNEDIVKNIYIINIAHKNKIYFTPEEIYWAYGSRAYVSESLEKKLEKLSTLVNKGVDEMSGKELKAIGLDDIVYDMREMPAFGREWFEKRINDIASGAAVPGSITIPKVESLHINSTADKVEIISTLKGLVEKTSKETLFPTIVDMTGTLKAFIKRELPELDSKINVIDDQIFNQHKLGIIIPGDKRPASEREYAALVALKQKVKERGAIYLYGSNKIPGGPNDLKNSFYTKAVGYKDGLDERKALSSLRETYDTHILSEREYNHDYPMIYPVDKRSKTMKIVGLGEDGKITHETLKRSLDITAQRAIKDTLFKNLVASLKESGIAKGNIEAYEQAVVGRKALVMTDWKPDSEELRKTLVFAIDHDIELVFPKKKTDGEKHIHSAYLEFVEAKKQSIIGPYNEAVIKRDELLKEFKKDPSKAAAFDEADMIVKDYQDKLNKFQAVKRVSEIDLTSQKLNEIKRGLVKGTPTLMYTPSKRFVDKDRQAFYDLWIDAPTERRLLHKDKIRRAVISKVMKIVEEWRKDPNKFPPPFIRDKARFADKYFGDVKDIMVDWMSIEGRKEIKNKFRNGIAEQLKIYKNKMIEDFRESNLRDYGVEELLAWQERHVNNTIESIRLTNKTIENHVFNFDMGPTAFERWRRMIADRLFLSEAIQDGTYSDIIYTDKNSLPYSLELYRTLDFVTSISYIGKEMLTNSLGAIKSLWVAQILLLNPGWHVWNSIGDGIRSIGETKSLVTFLRMQAAFIDYGISFTAKLALDSPKLVVGVFKKDLKYDVFDIDSAVKSGWTFNTRFDKLNKLANYKIDLVGKETRAAIKWSGVDSPSPSPAGEFITAQEKTLMASSGLMQVTADPYHAKMIISTIRKNTQLGRLKKNFYQVKGSFEIFSGQMEEIRRQIMAYDLIYRKAYKKVEAEAGIKDWLFDYRDLTKAGQTMRLFFPFYAFTTKSVQLYLKTIMKYGPAVYNAANALLTALEKSNEDLPDQYKNRIQLPGGKYLWLPRAGIADYFRYITRPWEMIVEAVDNPLHMAFGLGWSPFFGSVIENFGEMGYFSQSALTQDFDETGWWIQEVEKWKETQKGDKDFEAADGITWEKSLGAMQTFVMLSLPTLAGIEAFFRVDIESQLRDKSWISSPGINALFKKFGLNIREVKDIEKLWDMIMAMPPHTQAYIRRSLDNENPELYNYFRDYNFMSKMLKIQKAKDKAIKTGDQEEIGTYANELDKAIVIAMYYELQFKSDGAGNDWIEKDANRKKIMEEHWREHPSALKEFNERKFELGGLEATIRTALANKKSADQDKIDKLNAMGIKNPFTEPFDKDELRNKLYDRNGILRVKNMEELTALLNEYELFSGLGELDKIVSETGLQLTNWNELSKIAQEEKRTEDAKYYRRMAMVYSTLPNDLENLSDEEQKKYWEKWREKLNSLILSVPEYKQRYEESLPDWEREYQEKIKTYQDTWSSLISRFGEEGFKYYEEFNKQPAWFKKLYFKNNPGAALYYPVAIEYNERISKIGDVFDPKVLVDTYGWLSKQTAAIDAWDKKKPGQKNYILKMAEIWHAELSEDSEDYFTRFYKTGPGWDEFRKFYFAKEQNKYKEKTYPFIRNWIGLLKIDEENRSAGTDSQLAQTYFWSDANKEARDLYDKHSKIDETHSKVDYQRVFKDAGPELAENPGAIYGLVINGEDWFRKQYWLNHPEREIYYPLANKMQSMEFGEGQELFFDAKNKDIIAAWEKDKPGTIDYRRFWYDLNITANTKGRIAYLEEYFDPKNAERVKKHEKNNPGAINAYKLWSDYEHIDPNTWEGKRERSKFLKENTILTDWWNKNETAEEKVLRETQTGYFDILATIPENGKGRQYIIDYFQAKRNADKYLSEHPELQEAWDSRTKLPDPRNDAINKLKEQYSKLFLQVDKNEFLANNPELQDYFWNQEPPGIRKILFIQSQYFKKTTPEERDAYAKQHPELIEYWEVKRLPNSYFTDPERFKKYQAQYDGAQEFFNAAKSGDWNRVETLRINNALLDRPNKYIEEESWLMDKIYSDAMKAWPQFFGTIMSTYYFRSLPQWLRDEYFRRHPDSKMLSYFSLSRAMEEGLRLEDAQNPTSANAIRQQYKYGKDIPYDLKIKIERQLTESGKWEDRSNWTKKRWSMFWEARTAKVNGLRAADFDNIKLLRTEMDRVLQTYPLSTLPKPIKKYGMINVFLGGTHLVHAEAKKITSSPESHAMKAYLSEITLHDNSV